MSLRPARWTIAVAAFAVFLLILPKTGAASTIIATVSWGYDWGFYDPTQPGLSYGANYSGAATLVGTFTWTGPYGTAWAATLSGDGSTLDLASSGDTVGGGGSIAVSGPLEPSYGFPPVGGAWALAKYPDIFAFSAFSQFRCQSCYSGLMDDYLYISGVGLAPEPSAAVLFGLGALLLALWSGGDRARKLINFAPKIMIHPKA